MDLDGSNVVQLTSTAANELAYNPAWSPDGQQIAYALLTDCSSGGDNADLDIWKMGADGSNPTQLTSGGTCSGGTLSNEDQPDWSPDGTKIVFRSDRGHEDTFLEEIYTMNPDGTQVTQVTDNVPSSGLSSNPSWSPDATKIAFEYFDVGVNQQIRTINVDGTGQTLVTTNGPTGYARDPSWSPDGQKIVFHGQESCCTDNSEVYTVNVDGTGLTQITNTTTGAEMPHWQPLVDTGGDDLVITDCDDPALATVTTVTGDLIADAVPSCDEISLPNLTSVTGSVTITDNQVTSISIGSIETTGSVTIVGNEVSSISLSSGSLETTGSVTIAGNEVGSISIGSIETTGSVTIADNGPAAFISLESVGATGNITLDSTGTGTSRPGAVRRLDRSRWTSRATTRCRARPVVRRPRSRTLTAEAVMRVVLPDGAYETACRSRSRTWIRRRLTPKRARDADGNPATIDPCRGVRVRVRRADAERGRDVDVRRAPRRPRHCHA